MSTLPDEFGALPGRVAVGGDSAGGNLSAVVCQLARDKARYEGGPTPVLQWCCIPGPDFTAQTRSMGLFGNGFLLTKRDTRLVPHAIPQGPDVDPADPRLSPLLAESLSGLAPAHRGRRLRPIARRRRKLCEGAAAAGTAVDLRYLGSLTHGFLNLFQLGRQCCRDQRVDLSAARTLAGLSRGWLRRRYARGAVARPRPRQADKSST
ncbi:alpha/beta hydrolase fold domain-containing protein [Mycobacterium tuberculosis]